MRILQIVPHYVPAHRFGGPQRVAHALGKALVDLGHSVCVCTTNLADERHDIELPLDTPVPLDGVTVYYEQTRLSRFWGFSPQLWRRAAKEIRQADIVFVHAHYQFANWAGAWLARRAQVPYIVFAHGSLHRQSIASSRTGIKRLYLAILEHRNLTRALFVAFNAPEEREQSLYREYGKVVPSGIAPEEFSNLPEAGAFRKQHPDLAGKYLLLFLGRLDVTHKGLDMLLPAFARLYAEMPQVHLVVAGPDENGGRQRLLALANQYGIEGALTFTGLIAGHDKLAALQDADLFVLPSRFEGLSIALLEALYVGLPVLVTDRVGLNREIAAVGAGVVVSAEMASITDGLRQLVVEGAAQKMRHHGKALIEAKYTWNAIAADLIRECAELIR